MRDLFSIFPDLPRLPRQPVTERVMEVRDRAAEVRRQVLARTARQKKAADEVKKAWRKWGPPSRLPSR